LHFAFFILQFFLRFSAMAANCCWRASAPFIRSAAHCGTGTWLLGGKTAKLSALA